MSQSPRSLFTLAEIVSLALLAVATGFPPTGARSVALAGGEREFRVDWERGESPRGPVMSGYVYNDGGLSAARVSLLVEALDASGRPVSSTIAYVIGTVPAFSRAYFVTPVPAAASYRVRIISYDWIKGGGGA
jgi:hypothetical protein